MGQRQCVGCGKWVPDHLLNCSYCREPLPGLPVTHTYGDAAGRSELRRGMLYMLLAAVFYYLAGGHSPFKYPFAIPAVAIDYLLPLLFLAGFGLATYGLYRRFTA